MKLQLFAAIVIILSFTSCAQRMMCPAYAVDDQHELKIEREDSKSM